MRKLMIAAALATSTVFAVSPVAAQVTVPSGLINVTVGNVSLLNNFLNGAQIAALNGLNVPITVQAPIGIAANVCGTSVAVLGAAGASGACTATSGSRALAQLVNRQLLSQKK